MSFAMARARKGDPVPGLTRDLCDLAGGGQEGEAPGQARGGDAGDQMPPSACA